MKSKLLLAIVAATLINSHAETPPLIQGAVHAGEVRELLEADGIRTNERHLSGIQFFTISESVALNAASFSRIKKADKQARRHATGGLAIGVLHLPSGKEIEFAVVHDAAIAGKARVIYRAGEHLIPASQIGVVASWSL